MGCTEPSGVYRPRRPRESPLWRLTEELLEPVDHVHWVFTVPKRLRLFFLYDRKLLGELARCAWSTVRDLYEEGIYVIGFFFPVVPAGQARIRTQMSADLDIPTLQRALEAFRKIGEKYEILGRDKKGIIAKYGM